MPPKKGASADEWALHRQAEIRWVVEQAPALSRGQREALVELLRPVLHRPQQSGHQIGMPAQVAEPPPTPRGPWMDINELAVYLGVPVRTIRTWRAAGNGPQPRKFGRHLRWNVVEVAEWADKQTAP